MMENFKAGEEAMENRYRGKGRGENGERGYAGAGTPESSLLDFDHCTRLVIAD